MKGIFRPPSLATRLGIYYSLGLALVVALGGIAIYFSFSASLEKDMRDDLADKVQQLRLAADDLVLKPQDIARNFFSKDSEDGVVRPLIRLMDANRRVIFESGGMRRLKGAPFPRPAAERSNRYQVARWSPAEGRHFRLASAWVATAPELGQKYLAELALDASREDRLLSRVRGGLLLMVALGMILAFVLGRAFARRELRHLDDSFERLSRHSSELSHELRTPLHNLMLRSEVALGRERSGPEYRRELEGMVEEIRRLSSTVDSVLFLARSADAGQGLKKETFDAGQDLRELAEFYEPAAEQAKVQISASGSAHVFADRELLRRALSNLVSNALKHSPQGGKIQLLASQAHGRAVLEVCDQGPGVPPESLARVFEAFYRVPGRTDIPGTGLGLAIVSRIVELHNGELIFQNLNGGGCRAGFYLLLKA